MSLHPIKALDHVIDEYADYLRTEFRAKDLNLRAALESELDAPRFLAQEPFYQAHRPFKSGKQWQELPIDAKLAKVMVDRSQCETAYLHQSEAIAELLAPAARPVVVTTGTGSGKTEAFLLPVIENAWQDATRFKKPGLTAILVYPMNALANDQELRINQYLAESGLAGAISVAKYDRGTSQADRERLRKNPPHILLTNYMMLEYLLVRPADTPIAAAAQSYRLLWDLNRWLIARPMSTSQIVAQLKADVPGRSAATDKQLVSEVEAALTIGAALPDGTPGALRLRAHRFIRGGWQFHRCLNPDCGRLYAMGEEKCSVCHYDTAPLYLCRNCGADYLRLVGDPESPLRPSSRPDESPEWMVYEPRRFESVGADDADDDGDDNNGASSARRRSRKMPEQIKKRPLLDGSLDPQTLRFSTNANDYSLQVTLVPARTRCLCCGGTAGSRNVITPVSLGTSAAVKVVGEALVEALAVANRDRPGHDGKERLLVFSDSRQDAAHQARFLVFASRYDRMRSRVVKILQTERVLTLQRAVELLSEAAVANRDNPHVPDEVRFIPTQTRDRIRAYEEAPLLDEIAVNAGYRGTLINLGLAYVHYDRLDEYVQACGGDLLPALGIRVDQLEHVCRAVLDEIRTRGCLSREMLRYHPDNVVCPESIQLPLPEVVLQSATPRAAKLAADHAIAGGTGRHRPATSAARDG